MLTHPSHISIARLFCFPRFFPLSYPLPPRLPTPLPHCRRVPFSLFNRYRRIIKAFQSQSTPTLTVRAMAMKKMPRSLSEALPLMPVRIITSASAVQYIGFYVQLIKRGAPTVRHDPHGASAQSGHAINDPAVSLFPHVRIR